MEEAQEGHSTPSKRGSYGRLRHQARQRRVIRSRNKAQLCRLPSQRKIGAGRAESGVWSGVGSECEMVEVQSTSDAHKENCKTTYFYKISYFKYLILNNFKFPNLKVKM